MINNFDDNIFILRDIPKFYFYVQNFGPYQQLQDFIYLDEVTCLSGPNGSGKSSLLDAIKTCIVANERYIHYNPKGGRETTLKEYLNTFNKDGKIGPTIACFFISFPNNKRGYSSALFGIIWDEDKSPKYFFKEEISKSQSLDLIKNSESKIKFLKNLGNIKIPGKFHLWNNARDYHRYLDEMSILFYFPKNYDDLKSYNRFLKLLDECSLTLTSAEKFNFENLKSHLFSPHKEKAELEDSLNKIELGFKDFYYCQEEQEILRKKLELIKKLISIYLEYYEVIEIKTLLIDLIGKNKEKLEKKEFFKELK